MDLRAWTLVLNSLLLALGTCAVSLPLGAALAWFLVRTDLPGRRAGLMILGLMLFVPLYLQAAAWQAGFALQGWMLTGPLPPWLKWSAAIWIHAMAAIPWVSLMVGAGFWFVEPELEEQALLDGSPRQVFFRVTLPGALPSLALAGLWIAIITAGEMTVTDLVMIRTYAEEVYTRIATEPNDTPLAVVPGAVLTALVAAAGLALCAGLAPRRLPISLRGRWVFRTGRLRWPLGLTLAAVLTVLAGVPLGSLLYQAGTLSTETETGWVQGWSAGKCLELIALAPWRFRREFGWSLLIGTTAATAVVAAAIPLAWFARRGLARALPVLAITAACLAVPGPVLGLAIIGLLNRPEFPWLNWLYDQSILAPWLALSLRGLPVAVLVLWHALRTVPPRLLESAAVDGAGPIRRLCCIALPMRWPAIALAWLTALAVALGELAASILVLPAGVETLPINIYRLLHYGADDRVAGICLAQVVLFAALGGAAAYFTRIWALGQPESHPTKDWIRYNSTDGLL